MSTTNQSGSLQSTLVPSAAVCAASVIPSITHKKRTVVFSRLLICGLAACAVATLSAQETTSTERKDSTDDKTYKLPAFSVSSTQDKGYVVPNSGSALRTQQNLLDIPQSVQILTRDFIQDTGQIDTAAVLQFAGAQGRESGEFFTFRGQGLGYALIDGMADRTPYMDNIFVDSYAVVKGPAAVFYPNTSLGGVVLKDSRKPLPTQQTTLGVRFSDTGLYRAEFDTTGPITKLGNTNLSYRLIGAYQDGDTAWKNVEDKREVINGSLRFDLKGTTVIISADEQRITRPANPTGFITPEGTIFTGTGRDQAGIVPKGSMETFDHTGARVQVIQTFSPNWDARLMMGANNFDRNGSIVIPAYGVNYQTRQAGLMNRYNHAKFEDYSFVAEVNGRYNIWKFKNQSTFGFIGNESTSLNRYWVNNNFGGTNQPQRWVSIDDPNAADSITPLPTDQFARPANPGSRTVSYFANAYFQQIVEVIPNRLSLIGGESLYNNDTRSESNYAVVPLTASVTSSFLHLHRYGFVVEVTKNIHIYGLDSTTSLPPSSSRTQDGSVLAPARGKGKEVGLKMNLLGDRLFTNVGVFDYTTSGGSAGLGGFLPSGEGYVLVAGTRRSKGWDLDASYKITDNWQLMGNYYKAGGQTDDKGNPVLASARSTWSFFTKYSIPKWRLSFGGGANYTDGRTVSSSSITYPTGVTKPSAIPVKSGMWTTAFVNFKVNKHINVNLSVLNILNETYAYGWEAAYLVNPVPPRTFSLQTNYKF